MGAIQSCVCSSPYQDKLYGEGKRVMNYKIKKEGSATCTVCGREHSVRIPGGAKAETKKSKKEAKLKEAEAKS